MAVYFQLVVDYIFYILERMHKVTNHIFIVCSSDGVIDTIFDKIWLLRSFPV